MTAILIVSDRDAKRVGLHLHVAGPYVAIVQGEWDETAPEWTDPGYRVTCSADGGTCKRWDIENTAYPLEDLIEHAGTHVDRHAQGES